MDNDYTIQTIKVCGVIFEDFVNYKKPCMTIMFPYCSFKCNKEYGEEICHNIHLKDSELIDANMFDLIQSYKDNPITKAICFQGLEPFDSWKDVYRLVKLIRVYYNINDEIVIYTGYNKDEISSEIEQLSFSKNIIVKFGRFIPNQKPHKDELLGVNLSSDNQYAEKIS